uniref:Uncharacterized protein n=1 Tax=Arundo donax TaxID=35708 RepID=A0A0A8ZDK2_ARUDO
MNQFRYSGCLFFILFSINFVS